MKGPSVRDGNLALLQWLRANDCPWNERTCAVGSGHMKSPRHTMPFMSRNSGSTREHLFPRDGTGQITRGTRHRMPLNSRHDGSNALDDVMWRGMCGGPWCAGGGGGRAPGGAAVGAGARLPVERAGLRGGRRRSGACTIVRLSPSQISASTFWINTYLPCRYPVQNTLVYPTRLISVKHTRGAFCFFRFFLCSWNRSDGEGPCGSGNMELLQWARANECPWDETVCAAAAHDVGRRNFHVLQTRESAYA